MKKLLIVFSILLLGGTFAAAQESKAEVFGGYSFLRFNRPATIGNFANLDGTNTNGWNAALTGNVNRYFGITADFSGHYGEIFPGGGNLHNFLFGPQLRLPAGRASLFVHALGGTSHNSGNFVGSQTSAAYAFGGGLDWKVRDHVSLRVGQLDYIGTHFVDQRQDNVRFSTGLVLHF